MLSYLLSKGLWCENIKSVDLSMERDIAKEQYISINWLVNHCKR